MGDSQTSDGRIEPALLRLGRLLFGGLFAYMGATNLRNLEGRVSYAEAKDVPKPDVLVPAASGMLSLGGVGVALRRLPRLSAAAVAAFLLGVTPTMHDFWNLDGEDRATERNSFLKNAALFGAALVVLVRGPRE